MISVIQNPLLYLKRRVSIHLKSGHHFGPGFELLALGVDVVIKHRALGWELDGFELGHPPLAELHSVVDQLHTCGDTEGRRSSQYSKMTSSVFFLTPYTHYRFHVLIYTGVNTNQTTSNWQ